VSAKIHRPGFDFAHPSESRFASYFLSLMGLGTEGLRNRMAVKDQALLHYTSLFSQQPRSMSGLETLLSDYFKVTVKGRQFEGQWFRLDADQLTHIGQTGQNQVIGSSALLAFRVWDQQSQFQLFFQSLDLDAFLSFLPPGNAYGPLCQMTRFYVGIAQDFTILLTIKSEMVPRARLGVVGGSRLGWTSWTRAGETQVRDGKVPLNPRLVTKLSDDHGFDYERKTT
jgi:type VI secretion system protein ImpH